EPCYFPYIYQGYTYYTCNKRSESQNRYWCATTGNYDKDKKWSYCADTQPRPCFFPFTYKNKSYSTCTKDGSSDGQLWCATTSDYDRDSKWKACVLQEYGGNSGGQPCYFPFIFNNMPHEDCIKEDETGKRKGRYWCATTENYDTDNTWSFCADTDLPITDLQDSLPPCVFPFLYKGKSYDSCTSVDISGDKKWCSLTANYGKDGLWRGCTVKGEIYKVFLKTQHFGLIRTSSLNWANFLQAAPGVHIPQ
uniref:Fibronectin type-II domain-containing protein n=1 Tax=Salvator merianae TaxID=96440 RepID=A0A8D0E6R9_SALMN